MRPMGPASEIATTSTRLRGAIPGLVGSWVKAFTEPRLQVVAESAWPPSAAQKLEVGADPRGHPQNMPPAVIVGRLASAFGHRTLTDDERVRAQRVIHYGFGCGLGVAYSAVAKRWRPASRGGGAAAGLAIYAGTHGIVLPAAGVQRPPWRLPWAAVAWEAASHVAFGAALESARRALEAIE